MNNKSEVFLKIGVVGAGAFGTSLAIAIHQAERDVFLWARRPAAAMTMKERRENVDRLPGVKIPMAIDVSSNLERLSACELALYVGPAQEFRGLSSTLHQTLAPETPMVICAKGIEIASGLLLSEVANETMPERSTAILSGPSFANDIAMNLPTALTLACQDEQLGTKISATIGSRTLRPYWSSDVIGVQIGGALKNVIAIACGIVHGKGLGDSARTALMTRGLAEMARLTEALGGQQSTMMGLSGLGDLALSCGSPQSRNMSFGQKLGQGETVGDILANRAAITEGFTTTKALISLARGMSLDMPIAEAVYAVLYEDLAVDEAISLLLTRPYKKEI